MTKSKKLMLIFAIMLMALVAAGCVFMSACERAEMPEVSGGDHEENSEPTGPVSGRLSVPDAEKDADALSIDGENFYEGYDYTISETVDDDGQTVYVLTGTSSVMTEAVAEQFDDGAATGDAYIVVKIYVAEGCTVSYEIGEDTISFTNSEDGEGDMFVDDYLFVFVRLSGVDSAEGAIVAPESIVFTVTDAEAGAEETFVVSFSGIEISDSGTTDPSDEDE